MIESLKLIGFQAHKKTLLKFDPRITAIVGPTDKGKSAIIRALRWLACNKPFHVAWINHAAKNAVAILRIDGKKIKRVRGSKGNSYALDGKAYKAFGAEVPKPIASELKIGDLNFQGQHDSPFWFGESAGNVSRALNEIVDLGVIDDALSGISSAVRHNKSTVEVCEERLKSSRHSCKTLSYVDEMADELKDLRLRQTTLQNALGYIEDLREMLAEIESFSALAKQDVPDFESIQKKFQSLQRVNERFNDIADAVEDLEGAEALFTVAQDQLKKAERELHEQTKGVCPLCNQKIN